MAMPVDSLLRQVIFLGELEDMIHAMSSADFKSIAAAASGASATSLGIDFKGVTR